MIETRLAHLKSRLRTRYRTTLSQLFFRRTIRIGGRVPIVSFTFDDFPTSALRSGGEILEHYGVKGTYFASFGLMGEDTAVGQIFNRDDLHSLLSKGHELGCHTYGHLDPGAATPAEFEESIIKNAAAAIVHGCVFRSFAYPLSYPLPGVKRRAARHFASCRGGGQKANIGTTDLNLLRAYFLEKGRERPDRIKDLIDQNRRAGGWLIFAAHDISQNPSPFGCPPEFFEDIVRYSVRSGSSVLTVAQAVETLCVCKLPPSHEC